MDQVKESDWKLFRKRIPEWQERYMEQLCAEYSVLLAGKGLASDKFWELDKRIRQDRCSSGVCVDMRRSMMRLDLVMLLRDGSITFRDLEGFSDDLLNSLKFVCLEK